MTVITFEVCFALVFISLGLCIGWFLRRSISKYELSKKAGEIDQAREALKHLHELAGHVAADVGAHSNRMEQINEELSSSDANETEAVMNAVSKLLKANNKMQEQLDTAQEKLEEQERAIESHVAEARTDVLTGLPNRRALNDALGRCADQFRNNQTPFSVMIMDVDRFKLFNDTYGHLAGDEVLKGVAKCIRKSGCPNAVPARYGGEEFAVVLPRIHAHDATTYAETVRTTIDNARFNVEGVELRVAVSVGVSEFISGEDLTKMLKRADSALYKSKESGRNQTHWHNGERILPVGAKEVVEEVKEDAKPETVTEPATIKQENPPEKPETATEPVRMANRTVFLTTLSNRLAEWRRGGVSPAVLLVGIDDYQKIAAEHGREAGLMILRATTQFLNAAVREMDMVAHYNGATFAMLLPGAELSDLIQIAERLRQAIARCQITTDVGKLKFTVSIGGVVATNDDDTQKLLIRTEQALDTATEGGGNSSFYHNGQWTETATSALERLSS